MYLRSLIYQTMHTKCKPVLE